jgi:purine-binding chemotaxis protein CheW
MTRWAGDRTLEVLTLQLSGEIFALEATYVREILDLVPITEVPNGGPFVGGLINMRGKVVPLADLRVKFGMDPAAPTVDSRIIVVEVAIDGCPVIVGIRADKVYEITEVESASLEEAPRIGMRWRSEYIRCIAKRGSDFIVVLNIERLFSIRDQGDEPPPGVRAEPTLIAI